MTAPIRRVNEHTEHEWGGFSICKCLCVWLSVCHRSYLALCVSPIIFR